MIGHISQNPNYERERGCRERMKKSGVTPHLHYIWDVWVGKGMKEEEKKTKKIRQTKKHLLSETFLYPHPSPSATPCPLIGN